MSQLNIRAMADLQAHIADECVFTAFVRVLMKFLETNRPLTRAAVAEIGREAGVSEERLLCAGLIARKGIDYMPTKLDRYVIN